MYQLLASTYNYTTSSSSSAGSGVGVVLFIIYLAVVVLMLAGLWKVFVKAGKPGWGAIIPFYNVYLLLKIAGQPGWWLILFFIPIVNIIMGIINYSAVSRHFGRGLGTTLLLIFLPFIGWPILGFGDAQYDGGSSATSDGSASSSPSTGSNTIEPAAQA